MESRSWLDSSSLWHTTECEMCKRRAGACVVEHAPPPALGTPLLCCCFCCVGVCAGKQSSASTNWGLDRQTFQWSVANSSAAASQPNAPGFGGGVSLQEMWILQSRPEFRLNLWTLQCVCAAQSHVSQTPAAITQGAPFEQIVPLPVAVLWDKILQYKFYQLHYVLETLSAARLLPLLTPFVIFVHKTVILVPMLNINKRNLLKFST